jgi:hypothetical protein
MDGTMPLMHEPSLSRYSKTNFRHTNWRSYSVWYVSVCSIPLLARCLRGYARAKLQVCTGRCPRCRQRSRRTRIRGILGWEWKDLNGGNTNDRLLSVRSGVRIPSGTPYINPAKPLVSASGFFVFRVRQYPPENRLSRRQSRDRTKDLPIQAKFML